MTVFNMSDFKIWKFPNGEFGIQLISDKRPDSNGVQLNFLFPDPLNPDIYLPILIMKSLKEKYGRVDILNMPYIPYLRQDRSFHPGNPCATFPLLKILNYDCLDLIRTLNPHSNKNNFRCDIFLDEIDFNIRHSKFHGVAPDENAVGNSTWVPDIIFKKTRQKSGEISLELEKSIKRENIEKALIIDDLCDGGATFIECAKKLREMGYTYIALLVAHGFFSKGIDHLFDNGIDFIITSNSVCRLDPIHEKLRIFDCFNYEEIINE